ncbi:MAG: hypothetical protein A4E44_00755 [Methanosaeta sp. PtaB.Bin018]|nr:hypothetical protein [Methanothrix sp.]OPX76331.1 MAG: hypothetical protein A4E44_00755 [Methanosaeta sp. PtaB.Bin018]OPY48187.1 MAG: hypothetical protein A4E46_00059 [Methanosaeta sp. PtaU1.Bin016]
MWIVLLLIFATMQVATAMEPQTLGHGRIDDVLNLQTGARASASAPHIGPGGFAPPTTPQPKALSSAMMVEESERLLAESRALYEQTALLYNRSLALIDDMEDLEERCRDSALLSEESSRLARGYMEEAMVHYNRTRLLEDRAERFMLWLAYLSGAVVHPGLRDLAREMEAESSSQGLGEYGASRSS